MFLRFRDVVGAIYQRSGVAPPQAERDELSGVTGDGGLSGGVTSDAGGLPLTRAMNPWSMPEASV